MSKIPTRLYYQAAGELLRRSGFVVHPVAPGKVVASKGGRRLYVDVAGKNLPYHGKSGSPCFAWETWIAPMRLERLEANASVHWAEPWLAFCYAVLEKEYETHFPDTVLIGNWRFGVKLISSREYREQMAPRSPSWGEVNLPREAVLKVTFDPATV